MVNTEQRIAIHGLGQFGLQAIFESNKNYHAAVEEDDSEGLLLEPVTLEEVEHVYLGHCEVIPGDSAMFEAISTQRQQLATTMRAFTRVLNSGLNGTGISGGVENAPGGDDSGTVVGGAQIGKVRRIAGVPVMAAKIPLSDGQSTSIIFHSPTSNGKTIVNSDLLVAFQFLINKRDVTHVVAPIGGKDVSLAQVAQALSNLIEKNSGKFKKQQAMQQKMKQDTDAYQNEADKLENDRANLLQQFNDAQKQVDDTASQVSTLSEQLSQQKSINADLQKQLDALQNAPAPVPSQNITDNLRTVKNAINMDGQAKLSDGSTIRIKTVDDGEAHTYAILETPDGNTYQVEAKDMQGSSVNDAVGTIFKAYRAGKADKYKVDQAADAVSDTPAPATDPEPEPAPKADPEPEPEPTTTTDPEPEPKADPEPEPKADPEPEPATQPEGFRYALVNRPAGIGAVPDGQIAILPKDDNDPYSQYARNGVIVYPEKLTDEQMSQYELKYLPTQADYQQYAEQLAQGRLGEYAEQYLELAKEDVNTFTKNVSLQFKKAFPNVAYPLGSDVNVFMTDVIAALTDVAQPDDAKPDDQPPADTGTGTDDSQPDPMDVAQANFTDIANLAGVSADSVESWWTANGSGNEALSDLKDALTAAPSTANIEALKSAIDFGNTFSADNVKPMPEPEPTPQPDKTGDNDVPELDKQSNDAIAALKALLTYQSDDIKAIGEKLQEAQNAAQALVEAGTYEDNESLVNDVANNLIQLMAEIQKKGA
ncbi:head protein [Tatumella sp. OPLPL6]|uniref:antirestriction phage head protein DarA n=1 Tax=Tatumella sp. OPLPL6 TaxID=1928657 RepID=UPI0014398A7A|nr:head protein [Tatumella sp. OPLPL6]